MKAKHLIIIITIILLNASCATQKSAFDSAHNKVYVGVVERVTVIKRGHMLGCFTIVDTDMDSFFVEGKLKVKVGTPCYYYSNPMGTKVYVVWDGAKQSYEISQ